MAQVPQNTDPTQLPSGIADGYQRTQATPEDFGAQIGAAGRQLGGTLDQAGGAAADVANQRQQQINQIAGDDAVNTYMDSARKIMYGDPTDPTAPPGFFNLKGQAAVAAAPNIQKQLVDLQTSISGGLANPLQKLSFDQESRRYQNMNLSSLAEQTDKENTAYQTTTTLSSITNANNAGASNSSNPQAIQSALQASDAKVLQLAQIQGAAPETSQAMIAKNHAEFFKGIIESQVSSDPMAALNTLNANKTLIPGDEYAQMQESLMPRVNDAIGTRIAAGIVGGGASGGTAAIPNTASVDGVYNSMLGIESGHRQFDAAGNTMSSGVGGADAPVGISQIKPSTAQGVASAVGLPYDENRLRTDVSYNQQLGKEYLHQQLDAFGGDKTLAVAAYNAGPANVNSWIKQFGDPRTGQITDAQFAAKIPAEETRKYVTRVATENGAGAAAPVDPNTPRSPYRGPPDYATQMQAVIQQTAGMPSQVQNKALSLVAENYTRWKAVNATNIAAVNTQVNNLETAYNNGQTDGLIPTQQIRQYFEPAVADETIQKLNVIRNAGVAFKAAQWASPDDLQGLRSQMEDPNGIQGSSIKATAKGGVTGPGVDQAPAGVTPGPDDIQPAVDGIPAPAPAPLTPDNDRLRLQEAAHFEQLIAQRNANLSADPAGYVAASPGLAAARASLQANPSDPTTYQNYITASLAEQTRMGVQQPRILPDAQVSAIVGKITSTDPATGDIGATLNQVSQQYGQYWPQVFGELVTKGKLSPEYQTIAAMDTPGQVGARADFQRALQTPIAGLRKASDPAQITALDTAFKTNDPLAAFRQTTLNNSGGTALYNTVSDSVKQLATYYVSKGQDADTAVTNATNGILNNKYDFSGTMRVPKGTLPQVNAATSNILSTLKPSDLAPLPGPAGLTTADNQNATLASARMGSWIPNSDDTGLVLMHNSRQGMLPVKLTSGQPVTLLFANAAAQAAKDPRYAATHQDAQWGAINNPAPNPVGGR